MNLPPLPPLPPGHKDIWLSDAEIRAYAEQYGRLCAEAERDRLQARVAELEVDADYYVWRLQAIIPLFEEARDALSAISLVSAKLYGIDLSLGDRMDRAGTATREDFDTARKAKP